MHKQFDPHPVTLLVLIVQATRKKGDAHCIIMTFGLETAKTAAYLVNKYLQVTTAYFSCVPKISIRKKMYLIQTANEVRYICAAV